MKSLLANLLPLKKILKNEEIITLGMKKVKLSDSSTGGMSDLEGHEREQCQVLGEERRQGEAGRGVLVVVVLGGVDGRGTERVKLHATQTKEWLVEAEPE